MLSTTSEYALRSLTHLASQPKGTAILGRDLAEQCDIPANYLSKILLALRNPGILDAVRGSGGGYSRHRDPRQVRLIDIIELFEGSRARPECFLWINEKCSEANPRSAHEAWREVRNGYVRLLETTTLASIAEKNSQSAADNATSNSSSISGGSQ